MKNKSGLLCRFALALITRMESGLKLLDLFSVRITILYTFIKQNISDSILFIERTVIKGLPQARLLFPSLREINISVDDINPCPSGFVTRVGEDE